MKKIQSRYLLWALVATFSLNVAMPIFAEEPKQEKVSFAQRINLLIRAKEWLKETNELRKKVKAGTATKEERNRFIRRFAVLGTIIALLILIPGGVIRKFVKEDEELNRKVKRVKERIRKVFDDWGLEEEEWSQISADLASEQAEWTREDEREYELKFLIMAAEIIKGINSRDKALEKIQQWLVSRSGKEDALVGALREQAESILDSAIKRVKKLSFDLLQEKGDIEEIIAKVRKAEAAGVPARGVRGALFEKE